MNKEIAEAIDYLTKEEQAQVQAAWQFSEAAHSGQTRKSGDPYIVHIKAVLLELARMRMDDACLMAGILHDVPEDTARTLEDIRREFGEDVARLVNGVTKLGRVRLRNKEEQQARNLRKMFLAMAEDVRVIIIKLCDRLHNMRTISYLPRAKQRGIASETLEIYAPLANRLGMAEIRAQLEDLCLECLYPKVFREIQAQVEETQAQREKKIQELVKLLEKELSDINIIARVQGRPKHWYSIYRNVYITHKDERISDVLDALGIRIIVHDIQDCYQALGLAHRLWRPIIGRFKDYIAIPKANGYQSLHTGVITDDGSKVEIQIRTEEMDFLAEYGMAAHWKYKDMSLEFDKTVEERMNWIQQLLDWQKEFRTALDFVESLKLDLFQDQIFVFTPKGDVRDLPADSTPIDFAYKVHTELGHKCIGAKVNGRMVPLNFRLKSGDIVEVLTSRKQKGPSRDWLEFVKTSGAKQKIRAWFKRRQYSENVASGRKRVQEGLRKLHQMELEEIKKADLQAVAEELNYIEPDDMFAAVGYGELSVWKLIRFMIGPSHTAAGTASGKPPKGAVPRVVVKGVGDLLVKMAPCCQPMPGDKIIGYITRGRGITVHRSVCQNAKTARKKEPERVIPLDWEKQLTYDYEAYLVIEASDRTGLIRDVTEVISGKNIYINSLEAQAQPKLNRFVLKISVQISSPEQFRALIRNLERVPDVRSVRRRNN